MTKNPYQKWMVKKKLLGEDELDLLIEKIKSSGLNDDEMHEIANALDELLIFKIKGGEYNYFPFSGRDDREKLLLNISYEKYQTLLEAARKKLHEIDVAGTKVLEEFERQKSSERASERASEHETVSYFVKSRLFGKRFIERQDREWEQELKQELELELEQERRRIKYHMFNGAYGYRELLKDSMIILFQRMEARSEGPEVDSMINSGSSIFTLEL